MIATFAHIFTIAKVVFGGGCSRSSGSNVERRLFTGEDFFDVFVLWDILLSLFLALIRRSSFSGGFNSTAKLQLLTETRIYLLTQGDAPCFSFFISRVYLMGKEILPNQ